MNPKKIAALVTLSLLTLLLFALPQAKAQGGLTYLSNPGGGQIIYGPLSGVNSMSDAMGFMLKNIHSKFGDRPEIGKFFQARGSSSVATFFTLTQKSNGKPITGLVVVSYPQSGAPAAALLYDDTAHFKLSASPMMKRLNEVWHPEGAHSSGVQTAGPSGQAAPLRQTPFPDNSGSVGLPAGWRIVGGGGGTVHAQGPGGSEIHYGIIYPVMDLNSPQMRQSIQMQTQGGRMPLPGSYVAFPSGRDALSTLNGLAAQTAAKQRRQAPTYQIASTKDLGRGATGNCTRLTGTVDHHDNQGTLASSVIVCIAQPNNGFYTVQTYEDNTRPELTAHSQATMEAIGKSYRLNDQVLQQQTQAVVDQIHRDGDASMARAADSNAAFDRRNASLNAAAVRQDQHNSDFTNYILDQTVIRDTQTGEHATGYSPYADALVKADPNRYQYVPTKDLLRGVDY